MGYVSCTGKYDNISFIIKTPLFLARGVLNVHLVKSFSIRFRLPIEILFFCFFLS